MLETTITSSNSPGADPPGRRWATLRWFDSRVLQLMASSIDVPLVCQPWRRA
jgi:hypothetical protein